jgi:hypothetical protein
MAETVFGLSIDEADLDHPLLKVPDEPTAPAPRTSAPIVVSVERIRSHVRRLVAGGVTADAIAAQTGRRLSPMAIDALLRGVDIAIPVRTAE